MRLTWIHSQCRYAQLHITHCMERIVAGPTYFSSMLLKYWLFAIDNMLTDFVAFVTVDGLRVTFAIIRYLITLDCIATCFTLLKSANKVKIFQFYQLLHCSQVYLSPDLVREVCNWQACARTCCPMGVKVCKTLGSLIPLAPIYLDGICSLWLILWFTLNQT